MRKMEKTNAIPEISEIDTTGLGDWAGVLGWPKGLDSTVGPMDTGRRAPEMPSDTASIPPTFTLSCLKLPILPYRKCRLHVVQPNDKKSKAVQTYDILEKAKLGRQ